jgi:hypothetical protein
MDDDAARDYPWLAERDERFTLALLLEVGEVLTRHGYPAPTVGRLVDITVALHHAMHPHSAYRPPRSF